MRQFLVGLHPSHMGVWVILSLGVLSIGCESDGDIIDSPMIHTDMRMHAVDGGLMADMSVAAADVFITDAMAVIDSSTPDAEQQDVLILDAQVTDAMLAADMDQADIHEDAMVVDAEIPPPSCANMATNDAPKLKPTSRTGISSMGGICDDVTCVEYKWKVSNR